MRQVFTNFKDYEGGKRKEIFVEDGIISEGFEKDETTEIIDCKNLTLLPSFVDLHAHFRDPGLTYKEDLKSGSLAALKGGYTTVNLMGNTKPSVSGREVYEDIISRGKALDLVDIHQVYTITKNLDGKSLDHLDDLPEGVRILSDDGRGVDDDLIMYKVALLAKERGLLLQLHEEVRSLSPIDYEIAEDLMTIRDAYLSYKISVPMHFSHVSTRGSVTAIDYFKNLGAPITCEVTPHHISLSDRRDLRVNPPIRTEADRLCLIEMIKKGTVDAIATDHAPHSREEKAAGSPGFIGLETAFSTSYEALVLSGEISLKKLVDLMSTNPAKILKVNKGRLDPGFEADFTMVDLDEKYIYREEEIRSKSKNSLLLGQELVGRVKRVYKKGVLKYEDN